MHIYAIVKSAKIGYERNDGEFQWLGPLAIALFNFIVSKSVFSSEENHPLIFVLLGIVVALAYRAQVPKDASFPEARAAQDVPRRSPVAVKLPRR
jgi:hypothetical protein